MQSQFNNILSSNAKYLAHEYLNQSYESFDFAKIAAELSQAKLQFASPAHFARLLKLSFIYVGKEISYKWKAMGKTFTMHQHVYEPIFKALKDHSMVSAQEIQVILSAHHKRKAAFNELV
ncbi:methyltransferase regulatory domain-containing protein [Helicobacter pylori]|uniref:methyltransferase regulatory domain-containing protein n=1 Tax=Helicobacter pylori TaxID=210 RepID=UPI0039E07467